MAKQQLSERERRRRKRQSLRAKLATANVSTAGRKHIDAAIREELGGMTRGLRTLADGGEDGSFVITDEKTGDELVTTNVDGKTVFMRKGPDGDPIGEPVTNVKVSKRNKDLAATTELKLVPKEEPTE